MIGRVIRGNARIQTIVGTVTDQHGVDLTNSMARASLTQSPMARGTAWGNGGLPGDGVNAFTNLTDSIQQWIGLTTTPLAAPRSKTGDQLSGTLPSDSSPDTSVGWMDLGRGQLGVGYGS